MTNHLTPAAIDKAAKDKYSNQEFERNAFILGANHVLSHLPDYAIGFAEWLLFQKENSEDPIGLYEGGFFYESDEDGDQPISAPELHAEYVKWLESNNK